MLGICDHCGLMKTIRWDVEKKVWLCRKCKKQW